MNIIDKNKGCIVVNFFGVPSAGKSTGAAQALTEKVARPSKSKYIKGNKQVTKWNRLRLSTTIPTL